ncbi:hypothetical protein BSQ40_28930 [Serratia fonticola]|nr:hypothetical protein BSQ40_28930 [Serratia fonticola]
MAPYKTGFNVGYHTQDNNSQAGMCYYQAIYACLNFRIVCYQSFRGENWINIYEELQAWLQKKWYLPSNMLTIPRREFG